MTRTASSTILALALAAASAACQADSGDEGNTSPPIIGGSQDDADTAVGLLRIFASDGSLFVCTATLIAPSVMLTAAHCADRALFDVSFETEPDLDRPRGSGGAVPADVIANPAFTGDPLDGHDVAVVRLGRRVSAQPVALGPTPSLGDNLRAVGYGMDVFGQDGTGVGVRRALDVTVSDVSEHEIVTGIEGASTCHGDSGGPFLDSQGRLVATTSFGDDADCHGSSHNMLVDDNLDFLAPFLDRGGDDDDGGADDGGNDDGGADDGGNDDGGDGGEPQNHCVVTQNGNTIDCTNGDCTCLVDGEEVGTCTAPDPATACSSPGNCCGF